VAKPLMIMGCSSDAGKSFVVTALCRPMTVHSRPHCGTIAFALPILSAAAQLWDTATWMQELSRYTTLHPGNVLWMGTEGADGDMVPGDVIAVEIRSLGVLRNSVTAEA